MRSPLAALQPMRPPATQDYGNLRPPESIPSDGKGASRMKVRKQDLSKPLTIAAAVVAMVAATFIIVEFGPWTRQAPNREATKAVAESAGAKVTPTKPKSPIEPTPPGPRPIEPAASN